MSKLSLTDFKFKTHAAFNLISCSKPYLETVNYIPAILFKVFLKTRPGIYSNKTYEFFFEKMDCADVQNTYIAKIYHMVLMVNYKKAKKK